MLEVVCPYLGSGDRCRANRLLSVALHISSGALRKCSQLSSNAAILEGRLGVGKSEDVTCCCSAGVGLDVVRKMLNSHSVVAWVGIHKLHVESGLHTLVAIRDEHHALLFIVDSLRKCIRDKSQEPRPPLLTFCRHQGKSQQDHLVFGVESASHEE